MPMRHFSASSMKISRDETSVNLRLLHLFEGERNADFPQWIERGICNLHIVHNAFKIRAKSNCDLEKIMNGAYHKFYDTSHFKVRHLWTWLNTATQYFQYMVSYC